MLETVIYLLLLFGIFLAGLANHIRWRRRMIRLRQHWMEKVEKVRVEYEVVLSSQEKSFAQKRTDFRRREQLMGRKILESSKKIQELSASNEVLWRAVTADRKPDDEKGGLHAGGETDQTEKTGRLPL